MAKSKKVSVSYRNGAFFFIFAHNIKYVTMNKKRLFILLGLLLVMPAFAAIDTENLNETLKNLLRGLKREYQTMSKTQTRIAENYEEQHNRMVNLMKQCNQLSLLLYSQKQEYTFDLCYTLEKVTDEFNAFEKDRMPYERIVGNLDIEIDRYARLIESLRRMPPELDSIYGLADTLLYRNDSLNEQHQLSASQLELTIEAATLSDTVTMPFMLDEESQRDREMCIFYARELLKMYFESKAVVVADSIHYSETYMRLKESYDYASNYYRVLQDRIFVAGQAPWTTVLADFGRYWNRAKEDTREKYAPKEFASMISDVQENQSIDSLMIGVVTGDSTLVEQTIADNDTLSAATSQVAEAEVKESVKFEYSFQILILGFIIAEFFVCWLLAYLLLLPVFKHVKSVNKIVSKEQRRYVAMLLGIIVAMLINLCIGGGNTLADKAFALSNTFMWLLAAIVTALIIRLKPEQLKNGIKIYLPTIFTAVVVIGCRILFLPNSLMNIIFPPFLVVFFVWQLVACLWRAKKADKSDRIFGWISLVVAAVAMIVSLAGFIFASLLILVWWYFQIASILTIVTVTHLLVQYKERRMNRRISDYLAHITQVTGQNKKSYLFSVTWFYDLVKTVVLPLLTLTSFPFCLNLAMNVFDFKDLYNSIYYNPFIQFTNDSDVATFRVSFHAIVLLASLFFVFRYANQAIHAIWQQSRYASFLKKTKRETIHKDEVNLSLGNSIINLLVWFIYIVVIVLTLHIPTGSLSLVVGGLSAGVGIALKDILNNFIYGLQLMSGRLKIGDWIECDGVRGKVVSINYQSTQIETATGAEMSILNATLFNKNFSNLTHTHAYELVKINVDVAYGTDVKQVRTLLENSLQSLMTKDAIGRDVVDAKRGITVAFGEFNDSAVSIAVKQWVLVAERAGYIDRAKELIYETLNENNIEIPFPQCDVHVVQD